MARWLTENVGTIILSLALIALVAWIVAKLCRDKRQGKASCGGNCGCCPMAGSCHKNG